jgi:hypothetical protein
VFLGLRAHGCGTGSIEGGRGVLGIRTIVIGAESQETVDREAGGDWYRFFK